MLFRSVLALDTVILAGLLEASGPVTLDDQEVLKLFSETELPTTLSAANVVSTLLSDVYAKVSDPAVQDVYFAAVAERVFDTFTGASAKMPELLAALNAGSQEQRVSLWSAHDSEQDVLLSTPLGGSVTGYGGGGASFGVYFNDGTGAKMDYYATRTVQLIQACTVGDYGQYTVRVSATNNAPSDAASSLPAYVTGRGAFGVEPGNIRTNYVVYGPSQAFVETASIDGQSVPVSSGKHGQRDRKSVV